MGCTASKLDNEDTVRRCKDRRRLMKEAVFARHHLAAAHADYCRSLRLTGSALCVFAAGEPLSVSDQTPAVFLHSGRISPQSRPKPPPSTAYSSISNRLGVPSPSPSLHPPPPPPFSPSPTIASSKLPHILSASNISSSGPQRLYRRRKQPSKLPHILSESSPSSSPRSQKSNFSAALPTAYPNSTYSSTPSQTSSVWNWENFYPPSPPNSEFFQTRAQTQTKAQIHDKREEYSDYEDDTDISEHKFFHQKTGSKDQKSQQYQQQKHHLDDSETDREEVQCSEWGDRYSSTASSDADEDGTETERNLRSEMESQSNVGSSIRTEPVAQPPPAKYSEKFDDGVSSMSYQKGEISDMRMVIRHKDLKEIVEAISENFENAAEAGDGVAEILEIGRAQLDRSFRQLKKTVYHSSSVLSNLSSSWTSKPPLAVKYRLDTSSLEEPGAPKSLCSTLERILAWEKKLYEEVKRKLELSLGCPFDIIFRYLKENGRNFDNQEIRARESGKIEHEKKLSALQSQEYRGEDEIKLDKTKASIKRLQSVIIVTSQAVSTTSTAINGLRDSDLIPQLVELCHGFMYMWRSMHQYHDIQNNIIQQVRGLVNRSTKGDSTSELHRQATRDLESSISGWHSSFCKLIKFQRDFIQSLHGWFKLSLVPLNNENNSSGNKEYSDVYAFCDEWKLALDRVPDMVASEAIKSFINVVRAIAAKQSEEIKVRKRTETASKELEKKASSLRNIEKKFYNSYSMTGIGVPHNGHALDAHDPLAEKKSELIACQRRVEDEMMKHSKAVEVTRSMTLNNLQTGLPGVFQALTSFAALFSESLESVCTRSYAIR